MPSDANNDNPLRAASLYSSSVTGGNTASINNMASSRSVPDGSPSLPLSIRPFSGSGVSRVILALLGKGGGGQYQSKDVKNKQEWFKNYRFNATELAQPE
jgi:hypothetical protein